MDTRRGVKGNRSPHCVDVLLGDLVLTKKLTSSVSSIYLKTICSAAVLERLTWCALQFLLNDLAYSPK